MQIVCVSAAYTLLESFVNRLNEYQSTGSPAPILYPEENRNLDGKIENDLVRDLRKISRLATI